MPSTVVGALTARSLEDCRNDVDDVVELRADSADVVDMTGPRNRQTLPRAAEMRRHLLGPLEGRVERPRPRDRHMRIGVVGAPILVVQHLHDFRQRQNAVVGGQLIEGAFERALGARAVVADNVDDQRVVELALVLHFLDDAADFMVGVGGIGGEHFGLARVKRLLDQRERVPSRQLRAAISVLTVGPGRKLRLGRDDAEPLLVGENLLAQLFPAHVELAVELVDPFLRRLVRRMAAARHIIEEERLVGRGGVELPHVMDGVVREIGGEVVTGLADPRINRARVAVEIGRPLVGLAAEEAIKVLEAQSDRPLVEGPGRAVLVGRNVVVLAEPGCRVAVVAKNPADRGVLRTDDGIVARIAGRQFADHAIADLVMVAPGDQRRARRRAKGGRVEFGVAQARRRDAVERRRRYDAAERAGNAVALVVGHDEQDVRARPSAARRAAASMASSRTPSP